MNNPLKPGSAAWMFQECEPGSLYHAGQMINLAMLRLLVTAFYKPIAKPLLKWLSR